MKKLPITLLYTICLLLLSLAAACGSTGSEETANDDAGPATSSDEPVAAERGLTVNFNGKETKMDVKSTWLRQVEERFNNNEDTAAMTRIVLANYDLVTKYGLTSVGRSIKTDDQMRIHIQVIGDKGTDSSSPIKTGKYKARDNGPFNAIYDVTFYHLADGKETGKKLRFGKVEGYVDIKEVAKDGKSGETVISGEIDVTDGENSVKGNFRAQEDKNAI